jgi:flagellum-specific peptidoglycan hydrolase FlgJ
MLTPVETTFAQSLVSDAKSSGHPYPGYAAAEAFLESASYNSPDGKSGLAEHTNDVFGLKQPSWWTGQIFAEQTREVINGVSEMVAANWPAFETLSDAFNARLKTLQALPSIYGMALQATSGPEFVRLVSAAWVTSTTYPVSDAHPVFTFPSGVWQFDHGRWSTAPNRASSVLLTYTTHVSIFGQ